MKLQSKNYFLSEFIVYSLYGLITCIIISFFIRIEPNVNFWENELYFIIIGLFSGLILWIWWRGLARALWSSGWRKFIFSIASLGLLPLCLLFLDLNAKFVVSKFYSGEKSIPYTFFKD